MSSNDLIITSTYDDIEIPDVPVHEFVFEKNIKDYADKDALIDGPTGRKYTYGQLYALAGKCAAGLSAKGLGAGETLCIYSPNLPEYAIAFHAVGMLGSIVTTCNPLYTPAELEHQLTDSGAKFILTIPLFLENAQKAAEAAGSIQEIFVFGDAPEGSDATPFAALLQNDGEFPKPEITKDTIFALPYSSGTTGKSKGVVLTHGNIVSNLCQIEASETWLTADETLIGLLPFYHIYAMTLVLNLSLRLAETVIVVPKFEFDKFLGLIQEHKISILHIVPPIVLALAKHPLVDQFDLSSVKLMFSGAAPLGGEMEKLVCDRIGCQLKQGYGATEMSPVATINPQDDIRSGSCGKMMPNMKAKIVNTETGEMCKVGEDGELMFAGPNIMKEYLNRPEATKDTIEEDGFMHTGDIGHVDEDGFFYIVDRLKELIKYKGYQVAPAELEELLLGNDQVTDCAVIGRADEEAGELPKAFVVLAKDSALTEEDIQKYIADQVAPHKKLRGGVEFVESIPKSASGKILRRVLRDQENKKE